MTHSTITFSPQRLESAEQAKAYRRFLDVQKEISAAGTAMRDADNVENLDMDPARDRVAVTGLGIGELPFDGVAAFDANGLERLSVKHASLKEVPPDFYGKLEVEYGFEKKPESQTWRIDRVSGWADWQGILMEETTSRERFVLNPATGTITYDADRGYYRDSD